MADLGRHLNAIYTTDAGHTSLSKALVYFNPDDCETLRVTEERNTHRVHNTHGTATQSIELNI